MVQDVSYHFNAIAHEQRRTKPVVTINAAIEESTVRDRDTQLLEQDRFICEHLAPQDVLVVSMAGNDVALRPTLSTILSMLLLTHAAPKTLIRCGWAPGQGYFEHLFGERVRRVAERVVSKTKPALIVICMLYYLDERPGGSWADPVLSKLGYDRDPAKLQLILSTMCERLTRHGLHIEGNRVAICPLFEALDGSDPADYCERVEPSVQGGRKMAERIWRTIEEHGALNSHDAGS
jgi:lysophospholipase L1-like esterase